MSAEEERVRRKRVLALRAMKVIRRWITAHGFSAYPFGLLGDDEIEICISENGDRLSGRELEEVVNKHPYIKRLGSDGSFRQCFDCAVRDTCIGGDNAESFQGREGNRIRFRVVILS